MQTITATFADGLFEPACSLELPPNSEVRLTFELLPEFSLKVRDLNAFLRSLPSLGDDAEKFAQDIADVRAQFPKEASPWD